MLRPDGRVAIAVWRAAADNPAFDAFADALAEVVGDSAGDLVVVHATMRGHQSNPHTLYAPDGTPAQVMPNHGRAFAVTQTH